ncbi:preprotein translocase subunit [Buchnera aphidicola (Nipponaphis monzeni)]|uniref:Protein translocase subunit SecY n=1 Tax=Buchnera aphidicola (Nipponaphis monzeni) TaxID=2495405 RepID=A0A455TAK0_9GAMM|nr:preprotein translocase subunit SecY [Buchnera aphidicola]BBI01381.1 preprotein translocase subunit [Buchnera aphidicola (Nipponaphis monzeni)]
MVKTIGFGFKKLNIEFNIIQKKIFFVVFSILIFRIGSCIPIPGIDTTVLSKFFHRNNGTILEMLNMFSGGALNRASIFSLGIMPYISSSIIVQLLTLIVPYFSDIKKEGDSGQRKLNRYIRYLTLLLATIQSIGFVVGLPNIPGINHLVIEKNCYFYLTAMFSLVTGTIFLMWLGELITDYGVGNGISLIIFTGIISSIPSSILYTINQLNQSCLSFLFFMIVILLIFVITYLVVFVEKSQRKITIHYGKQQKGRKLYAVQNTHLPLKVNIAGVIPAIFASSVVLFPATMLTWFGIGKHWSFALIISEYFRPNSCIYLLVYSISIFLFCFIYTGLVFNVRETSDNLKKSGAFIPGIRPGEQTSRYVSKIIMRLTLIGSVYIVFICLIPELMRTFLKVSFYFGGTSLLIVVVVIIDFINHLQTLALSNRYKSMLKKSNLNFIKD